MAGGSFGARLHLQAERHGTRQQTFVRGYAPHRRPEGSLTNKEQTAFEGL